MIWRIVLFSSTSMSSPIPMTTWFQFLYCISHAISLDGIFGIPRGLANETSGASFRGWRDRHPLLSFPCGEPKTPAVLLLKVVAKRRPTTS